jgi:hypothetical protein
MQVIFNKMNSKSNMLKFFKYMIALVLCLAPLAAQEGMLVEEEVVNTRFGPYYSFKAGINGGNTPMGRQNAITFNGIPDFGALIIFPLGNSPNIGVALDLGYSTFSFGTKNFDTGEKYSETFSYVAFTPSMYFGGFLLGLSVGFPVAANWGANIDIDKLNIISDIRLNYTYILKADEVGSLGVFLQASYMLTGAFKDFGGDDPLKEYIPAVTPQTLNNYYNPRVVSLSLGVNYLFNM